MGEPVDDAFAARAQELVELAEDAADKLRWADAASLARRALALDPESSDARALLIQALEGDSRYAEAVTELAGAARSGEASWIASIVKLWTAPIAIFGLVAFVAENVIRAVFGHFSQTAVFFALLAIASALLVTTLVGLIRRQRRFSALTVEDRRFVGALERSLPWSAPERRPLLVVTVVVAILVAAAFTFVATKKPSLQIRVGDCFTSDRNSMIDKISAVACDLPHTTEVYALFPDPAPPGEPYPGLQLLHASAQVRCTPAFFAIPAI